MGRLSICHLQGCDAQRPDICLEIIARLLNYFWSHPKWCTNECVALRLDVCQLGRYTKVGQLDLSGLRKQNIRSFNVSVNLAFGVEVFEATEEFAADDGDMGFIKGTGFGFQLEQDEDISKKRANKGFGDNTRSRHDPPPKYSITIHSLLPRRKLALYCVT